MSHDAALEGDDVLKPLFNKVKHVLQHNKQPAILLRLLSDLMDTCMSQEDSNTMIFLMLQYFSITFVLPPQSQ